MRLSLFILSSKSNSLAYFFLPYNNAIANLVDGQNEKSSDLFTNFNYGVVMFALFIKPGYVFDHLSHSIPKKDIDLNEFKFLLTVGHWKNELLSWFWVRIKDFSFYMSHRVYQSLFTSWDINCLILLFLTVISSIGWPLKLF